MPFARIDLLKGKTAEYRATVADVVYQGIVDVLKAPDGDRFEIITEHPPENLLIDPSFLGIARSADALIIQVVLRRGRTVEVKQAFFKAIADGLNARIGLRREDVMINLVENGLEDWSFGGGVAQYVERPPG